MAELLHELLPRLRKKQGLSQNDLSHLTATQGAGVPVSTIQSYEKRANVGRVPEAEILEAFARALGVEPAMFYEWPLAEARRNARPDTTKRAARRLVLERAADAPLPRGRRRASPAKRPAPDEQGESKR